MNTVYSGSKKPSFNKDQLVSSTTAAKAFGKVRQQAKKVPQYIMANGEVDTVLLDYKYFEEMYTRLMELEEAEESRVLKERIEQLEQNPDQALSWKSIRKSE